MGISPHDLNRLRSQASGFWGGFVWVGLPWVGWGWGFGGKEVLMWLVCLRISKCHIGCWCRCWCRGCVFAVAAMFVVAVVPGGLQRPRPRTTEASLSESLRPWVGVHFTGPVPGRGGLTPTFPSPMGTTFRPASSCTTSGLGDGSVFNYPRHGLLW